MPKQETEQTISPKLLVPFHNLTDLQKTILEFEFPQKQAKDQRWKIATKTWKLVQVDLGILKEKIQLRKNYKHRNEKKLTCQTSL